MRWVWLLLVEVAGCLPTLAPEYDPPEDAVVDSSGMDALAPEYDPPEDAVVDSSGMDALAPDTITLDDGASQDTVAEEAALRDTVALDAGGSDSRPLPPDATPPGTQRSCPTPGEVGCGSVSLPGGTVLMGDPMAFQLGGGGFAIPTHTERVSGFSLDRYEVTVARFGRFMMERGGWTPGAGVPYPGGVTVPWDGTIQGTGDLAPHPECNWSRGREAHPMNCVTWHTAQAFCVWDRAGGRLPTEAEWEYAARGRGGAQTHPWARSMNPPAVEVRDRTCSALAGASRTGTCVVGSALGGETSDGIYDLVGNVWEWAADSYEVYGATCWPMGDHSGRRQNPLCLGSSGYRVLRGGSWYGSDASVLRSAARNNITPGLRSFLIGFRCAGTP
jgi:formylglycine-generating enzyme required for sulfatase activity